MTSPVQIQQLARIVGGQMLYPPLHPIYVTSFSIDTRTLKQGDVFVAIKGPHFNGNDFVEKAFLKGACCAIVSRLRWHLKAKRQEIAELGPGPLIAVSDTTQALAKLGTYFRRKLRAKVIAVTGSIGKTATREMLAAVLGRSGKTYQSRSNYNNVYGVPLSIFEARPDCEYLVVELGMNAKGEIAQLADICQPDYGVVTNVSTCHTEFFESLDDVADTKAELFEKLPEKGALFVNADDSRLESRTHLAKCKVVGFGLSAGEFRGDNLRSLGENGTAFEVFYGGESHSLRCPLLGAHNVKNALAAVAVGRHLGMSWDAIVAGLADTSSLPHRVNLVGSRDGRLRVLDDSYNSSPAAVRAAIDTLLVLRGDVDPARSVILVLGDMLELGRLSESEHYKVGVYVGSRPIDQLFLLGPLSKHTARGACDSGMAPERIHHCQSIYDLKSALDEVQDGAWVLVKGSRAWALDRLVDRLCGESRQKVLIR
ncbi:MAG TPA: UDP-N-acetylmuramoyl-tripeptide--D-alanyl-D-alanine ligase [bacterium]|nr:UDP-N-acetylmuramoyl-tripeptide--D-alanyl-D-alanine ligase [bacterium]